MLEIVEKLEHRLEELDRALADPANLEDRKRHGVTWIPHYRGEKNPNSKLTADAVRRMRTRRLEGWTYRAIAEAEGVHGATAMSVVKRHTWAHVD